MLYYSLGRLNIKQVGLFVPSIVIDFELGRIGLEYEWPILIYHADETGTSRPAIEPQQDRVIIRIPLGLEKHVMESAMGDVEIA